ncbi:MAG: PKD domain-containing protein, partial [Deinococcus sp.]
MERNRREQGRSGWRRRGGRLTRWVAAAGALLGGGMAGQSPGPQVQLLADARMLAPLKVSLSSGMPAGSDVLWQFGDGTAGSGPDATHTFYRPGRYQVSVRVSAGAQEYRATLPLEVHSAGPEQAGAVLLLGGGALRLSALPSVVYAPYTPGFVLDGRPLEGPAVSGSPLPLSAGAHTLSLRISGASGALSRSYSFRSGPLAGNAPFEAEVLRLTNGARAAGWNCARLVYGDAPRPALHSNAQLAVAARAQSAGMALNGYFDHHSPLDGSTPLSRVLASGYLPRLVGEHLAAGQFTPAEVVMA